MTKFQQILLMILLITSCKVDEKKEVIDELLIFGYSGFCYKDSVNKVYYSDEIFYNDSDNLEYDSTRLDIRQYFEFQKDSLVHVAMRRPRQKIEFLFFSPVDTIGFENLFNRFLIDKKYKCNYCFYDSIPRIYDGWYYTFYYKTSKNNSFKINYIPDCLPDSLKVLHDFVENFFIKNNTIKNNDFEYNPITSSEAKRLFKYYPPPKFDRTKKIKFEIN